MINVIKNEFEFTFFKKKRSCRFSFLSLYHTNRLTPHFPKKSANEISEPAATDTANTITVVFNPSGSLSHVILLQFTLNS